MLTKTCQNTNQERAQRINKNDFVYVTTALKSCEAIKRGHEMTGLPPKNFLLDSLALVVDTRPGRAYIIYVTGEALKAKRDPFWMDMNKLTLYEDYHGDTSQP